MADHLYGQPVSERQRLAREFEYAKQSIQYTADEQRRLHEEALAAAFQKHEDVRIAAEREGKKALQDLEQQRLIREHQEALELENARRETAQQAWNLERQRQEAIAAAKSTEEAAERQRQANEAAQRALEEARAATPKPPPARPKSPPRPEPIPQVQASVQTPVQHQSVPLPKPASAAPATVPSANPFKTPIPQASEKPNATPKYHTTTYLGLSLPETLPPELQRQYLEHIEILNNLKEHRKLFIEQIVPNPQFAQMKSHVGDSRRFIRKTVSQLTDNQAKNRKIMMPLLEKIRAAQQSPFPPVSLNRFIPGLSSGAPEVSTFFIYLVNVFTKAIFAQFLVDASVNTEKADTIGLFASQVLAHLQGDWQNQVSFWPFLAAKFARRCPVLFGVYGSDDTTEGKVLLGWGKEDGKFVTDQRHSERMTGLGAGWSSITLRNFDKSKMETPAPFWIFWRSIALIINVPASKVTDTHYVVLKAMVEHNEQRILRLFGDYGKMILRQAVVDYPNNEYKGQGVQAQGLKLLRDVWQKDKHFRV